MSLLYPLPCKYCGGFYKHQKGCISITDTGIAEKIMFKEIEQRHDSICYEQQKEIENLQAQLSEAHVLIQKLWDGYSCLSENEQNTVGYQVSDWLEKYKSGE